MNKDIQLLNKQIDQLFLGRYNTRYEIQVTKDVYDHTINFFLNSYPKDYRPKSTPMHTLDTDDLERMEMVIAGIKAHTDLPIVYFGCSHKDLWPSTGRVIQAKPRDIETSDGEVF